MSKQSIGICATQKNTARIQDILNDQCPNCGKQGEDNKHLNRCTNPGRVQLFRDGVRHLCKWMAKRNQTNPELIFWVREYLLHRGQVRMTNLTTLRRMSTAFSEVAQSQDGIGWVEFLHGKVSKKFRKIQDAHCILSGSHINGGDWMRQFVERLLHMSHSQWLYQNFTLHHYAKGYLRQRAEKEIMDDVNRLTETRPIDIPPESSYLLELPHRPQPSSTAPYKAYWVLAMRAAKANLRNKERLRATSSTRKRGYRTRTSHNLLEGVRESLYNRILQTTGGTKRNYSSTQQLEHGNTRCKSNRGTQGRPSIKATPNKYPPTKRPRQERNQPNSATHDQPTPTNKSEVDLTSIHPSTGQTVGLTFPPHPPFWGGVKGHPLHRNGPKSLQ